MKPTRIPLLLLTILLAAAFGYLLAETAYAQIPPLPALAPASLVLLAIAEAAKASVVRSKIRGRRPSGRALQPMQVAKAAVLA